MQPDTLIRGDLGRDPDGSQNHLKPQSLYCDDEIRSLCFNGYPDVPPSHNKDNENDVVSAFSEDDGLTSSYVETNNHEAKLEKAKFREDSDRTEHTLDKTSPTGLLPLEIGPLIWIPPEPANMDDDVETIANNEDDDDYCDGQQWGNSSFSPTSEDTRGSIFHKERCRSVMMEAMDGQFKILVSRFLASAGISSNTQDGKSWLDIIAALSWEAAIAIKPDAKVGKAMDPVSYVKVKCVASGSLEQSQVVRGLVFKKNAAHKHMTTKFYKPRLLLLRGVLGHMDGGLSSLSSMDQEKSHIVKCIGDAIEACRPNVVLVEKTVSRDIQELLLKAGVTLAFDMKHSRLERIARCTGSHIISFSDLSKKPTLKQCDLFRIEKFVVELNNSSEAGKKSTKTLMFLEGFPRPLGCTIILRGANSEELKKVKQVVQYAVFAAYHLIRETSFFEDQRVFLIENEAADEENVLHHSGSSVSCGISVGNELSLDIPYTSSASPSAADAIQLLAQDDGQLFNDLNCKSFSLNATNNGRLLLSESIEGFQTEELPSSPGQLQNVFLDQFQYFCSDFLSSYLYGDELFYRNNDISFSSHEKKIEPYVDFSREFNQCHPHEESVIGESVGQLLEAMEKEQNGHCTNKIFIRDDDVDFVMDQSILILMSSQCISKQTICEQTHLSRIKYYGNLDMSLGRYLQDILLNKNHVCLSCSEPPAAHIYSYTHRNGTLTVLVRGLPPKYHLPGASEGKIWMWTRCLRCEHDGRITRSTPRVIISTSACNLSFGKFLELSFSSSIAAKRLSKCGHSLHRDCLRFFGLGPMVAMFKYSHVQIYSACKPPQYMEFQSSVRPEWLQQEIKNVVDCGVALFSGVGNALQLLKGSSSLMKKSKLPMKSFSEVEDMLTQDKAYFENCMLVAFMDSPEKERSAHEILTVNWLYQDLFLALRIWDYRLQRIQNMKLSEKDNAVSFVNPGEQNILDADHNIAPDSGKFCMDIDVCDVISDEDASAECRCSSVTSCSHDNAKHSSKHCNEYTEVQEGSISVLGDAQLRPETTVEPKFVGDSIAPNVPLESRCSTLQDSECWDWKTLSECQSNYRNDLQKGFHENFYLVNNYVPSPLLMTKRSSCDLNSMHFIPGPVGSIISLCEDETSSLISYALSALEGYVIGGTPDDDGIGNRGEPLISMEKSNSSISDVSSTWSSMGSFDSERSYSSTSSSSHSSDDLSSENSLFSASQDLHPEISVNSKLPLKGKYAITCLFANQFYTLRKKCCSSELGYIASLSRCKIWDAKGGKSKALFSKTLDDRLVIKQIKRTEFDSFLKFAPEYFKYLFESLDSGNQTCLAKILGIYQIRQMRNGKELKIDLVVMENLFSGHTISRKYDLKGSVFSRHVPDSNESETVYLDQNFVEDMRVSPIYIGGKNKHLLQRAVWNDTSFLTSINVMDYSLVVGVDKHRNELVFGIIDYLRQYTWDKQLETWVKASLVVPKNESPTVISPKEYKKRFRKFMTKYFLTVPDSWTPSQLSDPWKVCSSDNESSQNTSREAVS